MHHHAFISDLHLAHRRVLQHDSRPYATIEEHDDALTEACAAAGSPGATLWLLGDVAFKRAALHQFMERVKPCWGQVNLIRGNHDDTTAWKDRHLFDAAHESLYLRVSPEVKIYLSHYPHRAWRSSERGAYHLHGHCHGAMPRVGRSMDVGAPCVGYAPITIAGVLAQLEPVTDFIYHHAPTH